MTNNLAGAYSVIRGESFDFGIRATTGTPTGSETVRAVLKAAVNGKSSPGDAGTDALVFSVSYDAAIAVEGTSQTLPGYRFTATAAQSALLEAGVYITDARIDDGSSVEQTLSVLITVSERVTEAA